MKISIVIPDGIKDSILLSWILENPKPTTFLGTDVQWFKENVKDFVRQWVIKVWKESRIKEAKRTYEAAVTTIQNDNPEFSAE